MSVIRYLATNNEIAVVVNTSLRLHLLQLVEKTITFQQINDSE